MPKVLFLTPLLPYPLSEGARLAQFGIIDKISSQVRPVNRCLAKCSSVGVILSALL